MPSCNLSLIFKIYDVRAFEKESVKNSVKQDAHSHLTVNSTAIKLKSVHIYKVPNRR